MTVEQLLYATDQKKRHIHIYHSVQKESSERSLFERRIRQMKATMEKHVGEVKSFGSGFEKYFILHYNDKTGQFQFAEERVKVIEDELNLCGYFCIVTSEAMNAKEAINLYKSRDASEKLFRGDKSYLGEKSMRVTTNERFDSKVTEEKLTEIERVMVSEDGVEIIRSTLSVSA